MPVPSSRRRVRETPEAFESRTSTRLWAVCAGFIGIHVLLLGNLYRVQIARHRELTQESLKRWQKIKTLRPERGLIYDRNGALLVQNEPGFMVIVEPGRWFQNNSTARDAQDTPQDRKERALKALRRALPQADLAKVEQVEVGQAPVKPIAPIELVSWISPETVENLRQAGTDFALPIPEETRLEKGALVHPKAEIPGVSFVPTTRRVALHGTRAAHILGFTDLAGRRAFRGLEYSQDARLSGQAVTVQYEFDCFGLIPDTEEPVNAKGESGPLVKRVRPVPGSDIILTLDSELQHDVEQALGAAVARYQAEAGIAIVLDATNGDILAMASAPTYNVNAARPPLDHPNTRAEIESRRNWCVESSYEPGSTLKALTLAAALEKRVVSPATQFYCTGVQRIGKRSIHCAAHGGFQHGHGNQDLVGVLAHSCNVATAACGARLGSTNLYHYFTEFGLGTKTNLGLPGESAGTLRDPGKKDWGPFGTANISFGQGVSVTPLQLAAAYTVFADGSYHSPRLIQSYRQSDTGKVVEVPAAPGRPVLSDTTVRAMREMLRAVVERGTGMLAQIDGYTVGGKTGTAQIPERGGYGHRFNASFIGLAPLDKPQFVILTVIRDPKGADHFGGSVAGPVFKEIAEKALLLRRVPQDKLSKSSLDANEKKRRKQSAVEG